MWINRFESTAQLFKEWELSDTSMAILLRTVGINNNTNTFVSIGDFMGIIHASLLCLFSVLGSPLGPVTSTGFQSRLQEAVKRQSLLTHTQVHYRLPGAPLVSFSRLLLACQNPGYWRTTTSTTKPLWAPSLLTQALPLGFGESVYQNVAVNHQQQHL